MKYVVRVANKSYEVEIDDIHARPVIARVDGEEFEVHLENDNKPMIKQKIRDSSPADLSRSPSSQNLSSIELTAPLPGTVIEIFVKAGEHIEAGQVVLVIEAMKMKNSIRSTRPGKIVDILVGAGQTVTHRQPLMRFG